MQPLRVDARIVTDTDTNVFFSTNFKVCITAGNVVDLINLSCNTNEVKEKQKI